MVHAILTLIRTMKRKRPVATFPASSICFKFGNVSLICLKVVDRIAGYIKENILMASSLLSHSQQQNSTVNVIRQATAE
jgi:hypothetical protein